ncbi:MAG: HAD-IIB family hydrolase [Halioglobus sp.]|nr:HAD-IIB family hydrolase [Halioglobus sp.]
MVISDLDGSLLDHHSYSFVAALPVVEALERLGIPLILASSKTAAEIIALRAALGNTHPFIVENGAAIYVPTHSLPAQPTDTRVQGDYWVYEMAPPRSQWLTLLAALAKEFPDEFVSFYSAGVTGIIEMTGLSAEAAQAANERCYSEPVKWLGSAQREAIFRRSLGDAGATVIRGGRFLSVSASCDKGKALRWLRAQYQAHSPGDDVDDLAIGDSENDLPMLEAARTALVIRSPVHDFPTLTRTDRVIHSQRYGPEGWAEGVSQWLRAKGETI